MFMTPVALMRNNNPFKFQIKSDNAGVSTNNQFSIPTVASDSYYDFYVKVPGDSYVSSRITAYDDADVVVPVDIAGVNDIEIHGTFKGWAFNNGGDKLKYLATEQVGCFNYNNEIGAFYGCENHEWNATDLSAMQGISAINQTWRDNSKITTIPGLGEFINSNITIMDGAFVSDNLFNEPSISEADTSGVRTFLNCFNGCVNFNQDISNFNFEAINVTSGLSNFLALNTALSADNYNALLISMSLQNIFAGQTPHFGSAKWKFGFGGQARFDMLSDGTFASVTDGGQEDATMGAWFNAHNVLKATANPSDSTSVTSWKDLSDNDLNAEEATNPPVFKTNIANGEPMVLFDGADSRLDIPADAALDGLFDGGGSFVCAIKPASDGEGNLGRIFSQGGGNTFLDVRDESGGACKLSLTKTFGTTNGAWETSSLDINIGEVNIIYVEYDSSSASNDPVFYINSTTAASITETSTPSGASSSPTSIAIGNASISNKTFDGHMGDLGFFKSTASSAERERRMNYLADKYGVTLS